MATCDSKYLEPEREQRNSDWSRSAHTPIKRISEDRDNISCHLLCCTNDLIDMKGWCCLKIGVSQCLVLCWQSKHPGNQDTSEASYRKQRFRYDGKFLAATKQLYEWYFLSVCPSVCLSVTPFWLCSHHCIIMKFSGVITKDQGNVHAKGQGQRSKVKVTEVTTQLNRFRTVTPVWIHVWWWNDTYSLMLLRRGALLFLKVICQISRSHSAKNCWIWPRLGVSGL